MQDKIAVLGSPDFCMPFSALGLDAYPVAPTSSDIAQKARDIIEAGYALVVVAENAAPAAQPVFETVRNDPVPCIVTVPFTTAPTGFATDSLSRMLKMATGINILQDT